MFTGLIQETGEIAGIEKVTGQNGGTVTRIIIRSKTIPPALKTGDSVAVSGVCLTALNIEEQQFSADLAEETLKRTTLQRLKPGALVNLELAALADDRMGGHVVQGHVDGTGTISSLQKIKYRDDWRLVIELPQTLARYVVPQGSITVEGISLTVAAIENSQVEIAIIPHTWEATNLRTLRQGDPVNIEVDVLAKYAEKMAQGKPAHKLNAAELIRQGF
ncbi:MAG TPA: riboflavin synthase [Candidatus Angelobacter sp.]|jgi:riboflavin synthase|nr:riboflavin synthase [Candidatus Angelobacter sp.]